MVTKMRMKAVFDCTADDAGEISFSQGDILVDVENSGEDGWYIGRVENTTERGLFPYNYVERISDSADSSPVITEKESWKNNGIEKTNLPGFPSLDAFELAMSSGGKVSKSSPSTPPVIISPKPKLTTTVKKINTPPPPISEKPTISPTRVRSYSTSATLNKKDPTPLRPSQLVNGKGTTKSALELALSKGPQPSSNLRSNSFSSKQSNSTGASNGVPLVGMTNLKLSNSISNEVEEEDGYQMVKPSQLRQKQQLQQSPKPINSLSSASSKPVSWKKSVDKLSTEKPTIEKANVEKSTAFDVPISSNPMPRLPSRPVSSANRRSRTSRSTSTSSTTTLTPSLNSNILTPVKETEKVTPPVLKPKPVLSQPNLPPRPSTKSRSTSNPPPIQPKPAMSSIEILLSKNAEKKSSNESLGKTPPRVLTKPVYPPIQQTSKSTLVPTTTKPASIPSFAASRPSLDNWRTNEDDANIKPSALLNRARSATNPTKNMSVDWSNMLTKPKSSSAIKTVVLDNNNNNVDSKVIKKATPPPPPPSRVPKSNGKSNIMNEETKHRYEILFDTIQDDGYVDGETARFIWMKSKLSSEELSRIWKECDTEHKGLLDKNAFIDGMGRIDGLLLNKQVI